MAEVNKVGAESAPKKVPARTKSAYVKKGGNGGARPNSGRIPKTEKLERLGVLGLIDTHVAESVEVEVEVTTEAGVTHIVKVKKPRVLVAMEKLFEIGVTQNNHEALDKWLKHNIGNPIQRLSNPDGSGLFEGISITFK